MGYFNRVFFSKRGIKNIPLFSKAQVTKENIIFREKNIIETKIKAEPLFFRTLYCSSYQEFVYIKTFFNFLEKKKIKVINKGLVLRYEKDIKRVIRRDVRFTDNNPISITPYMQFVLELHINKIIKVHNVKLGEGTIQSDIFYIYHHDTCTFHNVYYGTKNYLKSNLKAALAAIK